MEKDGDRLDWICNWLRDEPVEIVRRIAVQAVSKAARFWNGQAEGGVDVSSVNCICCDRFIGAEDVCPFCGEETPRPGAMRLLRWGALTLSLLGMGCLYLMVVCSDIPVVSIGRIGPPMNFSIIRVAGEVIRKPYVVEENGGLQYVAFTVKDETGEIRVVARGQVARDMGAQERIPEAKEVVDVAGALRVYKGGKQLRVQFAGGVLLK